MDIRPFQSGDEAAQLRIYNTAAADLPKFKPATILDIQRRTTARDFDPQTRFYATHNGETVGYCTWQRNGRVGYPWCLPGHESAAEPLFMRTLDTMKQNGVRLAFSAYRQDWPAINAFFASHGFKLAREMINFVMAFENMPTPSAKLGSNVAPATADDFPGIFALDPSVLRVSSPATLKEALWDNPRIPHESIFVMRDRTNETVTAAGVFIREPEFADARVVDSMMPCFRLGAFGSEGMTTKRIRGLFSFLAKPDRNIFPTGMDLLGYAVNLIQDDDDIPGFAAQVASDAPALLSFYERIFERQGSFPIHERALS